MKPTKIYYDYESLDVSIDRIWEIVILETYQGTQRIEYSLTENIQTAKEIAENYKSKLENCQEVVISMMFSIDNNKEYQEVFGRIVLSKRNDKIVETEDYKKL